MSYATPGVKPVTVSCGTSQLTISATVHHVDITNGVEYGIAGSTVPIVFGLSSNSFGPYLWSVEPASGPSFVGGTQGSTASLLPGNTAGAYTVRAEASFLPSCTDTATFQVVQATFSGGDMALCEGGTSNLTVTVNPPSALSLLSFDTVTNTTVGPSNTHAHVTAVNGTNLTIHGDVAGTAYLRVRLGSNFRIAGTIQIVRVNFPSEPLYVGVGKTADYSVAIVPTNASVTFDTVSSAIATAAAIAGGVRLSGVAPGTTQVRASVGGGAICSTKDVTAIRVKFSTNEVIICSENNRTVGVEVDPPGSPVIYVPTTNLTLVSVQGTNITISAQTNVEGSVVAKVGSADMDKLNVKSLTVRFPSNPWYAAPGGDQPFTVEVEPEGLARHVNFMSAPTNIATVMAGATPRSLVVHGVSNGSATITAWIGVTNHTCHDKLVQIVPPTIASVQWLHVNGSPITNQNPNPGFGLQVFPDSPLPTAAPSNQVLIRATVSPPVHWPNAVHFRVYDVDDPSSTNALVDDESAAFDNKGTAHTPPPTAPVSTDTNGIAEVTMTLSMQPGNNFRAVAATSASFFNDVGAPQNDGVNASVTNSAGAIPGNQITQLLTVWRRMHVEVDSMRAIPPGVNLAIGQIVSVLGSLNMGATQIVVNVNLAASDASPNLSTGGNGRFENGDVLIGTNAPPLRTFGILGNGGDFFRANTNQTFNIPFLITKGAATVSGQVAQIDNLSPENTLIAVTNSLTPNAFNGGTIIVAGKQFGVLQNNNNTVALTNSANYLFFAAVDDDNNALLPRLPDVSDLARAFGPAYVQPVFDLPNPTTNAPFILNMPNSPNPAIYAADYQAMFRFDNVATEASATFWTIYLVSAFQDDTALDRDPNAENPSFGSVDALNGQGAAIFLETLRDYPTNAFVSEAFTVSHEVGHLFNSLHTDGWLMAPSVVRTNINFHPITINRIRSIPHP